MRLEIDGDSGQTVLSNQVTPRGIPLEALANSGRFLKRF